MNYLSLEPLSGAAGDMILAALCDLGADIKAIEAKLRQAGLPVTLDFQRKLCQHGITCGYLTVTDDEHPHSHAHEACEEHDITSLHELEQHSHAHAHEYHHHEHEHEHHHEHAHTHEHHHEHEHEHEHEHHHEHVHRGLTEILDLIQRCDVAERAKERAERVFRRLAEAEAAIHGKSVEEIHFHEVGAVDSIADIFGTCIALEQLGVDRIFRTACKIGSGTVRCAHGVMPVPAPATAKLLEGQDVRRLPIESELTTPTGAAILVALAEGPLPSIPLTLVATGYGHGKKEFDLMPNVLRALLFREETDALHGDLVSELKCEIDDMSPEAFGFLSEKLFAAGALDVSTTPVQMKKNRPATALQIICRPQDEQALATLVLAEASTIGLRASTRRRYILSREQTTVSTPWGPLQAKAIHRPGGAVEIVPEYEAARKLALEQNLPLRQILDAARDWH